MLIPPAAWIALGGALCLIVGWWALRWRLTVTPGQDEVLVLSGRQHKLPDGSTVDYRVVRSGSTLRVPLVERLGRLDLAPVPVLVRLTDVRVREKVPMLIEATVQLRIAADDDHIHEAVRRFLGSSRKEIASGTGSVLERHLAAIASRRRPEELVRAPGSLSSSLAFEARMDLLDFGLEIAGVDIEYISDQAGYLASRGVSAYGAPARSPSFGEGFERARGELSEARKRQRAVVADPLAETAAATLADVYRQASWLQRRVLLSDLDSRSLEPLVEALVEACGDQDPATQLALAEALGRIGGPIGVPWLARAADSPSTGLARGAAQALARVRTDLQVDDGKAEVGALSIVDEARGHLSVARGDGRLALFERVDKLASDQLEAPRPVLDVHRWSAVSPPPRRVSALLVVDTLLWARGSGPFGWFMLLFTALTAAYVPAEWMEGTVRYGLLFFFGAFGAITLYSGASASLEDLRLFARGTATLAEVVNVGAFDRFDHDLEQRVSGFDYDLRYVTAEGQIAKARVRRSKRIAAIGDEALEPLLHLPGVGDEDVLMVDEMGSITVRRDGGLTVRSARSLVTVALVAATALVVVSQLP
jgi:hypothetical protein